MSQNGALRTSGELKGQTPSLSDHTGDRQQQTKGLPYVSRNSLVPMGKGGWGSLKHISKTAIVIAVPQESKRELRACYLGCGEAIKRILACFSQAGSKP